MVRKRFGEILLDHGIITQKSLSHALIKQKGTSRQIGQILEEIGVISEEDIARNLSRQFNIPYLENINDRKISRSTLNKLDPAIVQAKQVCPVGEDQRALYLAMVNPLDIAFQQELSFKLGVSISPFVATPSVIKQAIERYYLRPAEATSKKQSRSVLHIDRQDTVLNEVGKVLGKNGFLVHQGKTGKEALNLAAQFKPELIITDIQLKKGDGVALFKALQSNRETATIPVIAMSSNVSAEEESQLLDMGFFDVVYKPCEPTRLLARVRRTMRYFQSAGQVTARTA